MRQIDTSTYSTKKPQHITPEKVDLGELPPIIKPSTVPVYQAQSQLPSSVPDERDTTVSRHHDTVIPSFSPVVEHIRKAVREFGKEAATHRFTTEEKQIIADIIHDYKRRGLKTSENEIARIAINFIVRDYQEQGANSILEKVVRALNE